MTLPDEFQQWLREAFIATQFNAAQIRALALMQLIRWRRGEANNAIPGYATPPANAPGKAAPQGWSLDNFQRLAREGRAAAAIVQRATASRR